MHRKLLEFSNTKARFQTFKVWMDEFTEKYGKTAVIPALVNGVVSISLYPNRYLCRDQEHVKSAFPGAVGTRKNQSKTA